MASGEDADRDFLRKLSLRNEGFMRHIYEAADGALQLRDFYRQVSSPLLAHVKFTYPKEQIKEETVSRNQFRMVYAGSEIVVAGQLADRTSELAPIVSAFRGAEDGSWITYEIRPKVPVSSVKEDFFPLERLWAYLTIKQLLDQHDAAEQSADEPEKKALALALKYSFVTSLTSLVVEKPNETNAVDAEPVDEKDPQQNNYQQLKHYGRANSYSSSRPNRILGGYSPQMSNIGNGMNNRNSVNLHIIGHGRRSRFGGRDRGPSRATTTQLAITTQVPDEKKYHLENYSWALSLLNKSAEILTFWENETQIFLELSKDINAPRSTGSEEACSNSTSSLPGPATCVYLTRCESAKTITVEDYIKSYCRVDNKYAGVCCPNSQVDATI